jgi:ketosteroid isomerase-like protein
MDATSRFHKGGPMEELVPLLSEDIVWHVPGDNAIAGTYRGRSEVLGYFQRRREQAGRSLRFVERRVLVADDLVLHFAGGAAELDGQRREWETVGVYRVAGNAVVECWLVPSDQALFDQVWR